MVAKRHLKHRNVKEPASLSTFVAFKYTSTIRRRVHTVVVENSSLDSSMWSKYLTVGSNKHSSSTRNDIGQYMLRV